MPITPLDYLERVPRSGIKGRGTVVFLHAFPLNAKMWDTQLTAVADRGWRAIAPHFPGFGGSAAGARTVDDYAGSVIDLLDVLHVQEAVVLGCSMGGYVGLAVMRLAARYVHALVLVDTRSQPDTPEGIEGRKRMIQLVREKGVAAIADEMVPRLVGATSHRDRPGVVAQVRALALEATVEGVVGGLETMKSRPDSTPLLAQVHVPALVIVGEEDVITPPALSEDMHRAIAGSDLVIVPGSGHLPNLETPAAFNDALARFLDHRV